MKTVILLITLFICEVSNAQNIIAKFTTYDSCIGQPICFSDLSSSKNGLIKSWNWDFGDGNQSTIQNPCHRFGNYGVYEVKLIVTDFMGEKDSVIQSIRTYNKTALNFSINNPNQCLIDNRFDFNNTTNDTGKIDFHWDFGDGTFSNLKDVSNKKFLKDSTFIIKLISKNQYNCLDTIINSIYVEAPPKVDFTFGPACNLSNTDFVFTGTKTISKFLWNFDNESNSTLKNPSKQFKTIGEKKVKLEVASDIGCKDSLIKIVTVKKQSKAIFTVADICEGDTAFFINQSINADYFKWKFGDGKISTDTNPKHMYAKNAHWPNVTLVASVINGCSDSTSLPMTINALPISDFNLTYSGRTIHFIPKQTNNSYYRWLFGDGDSSSLVSPIHTFKTINENQVTCLKVMNAAGCLTETCKITYPGSISNYKQNGIKIYPNPNNGNFFIALDNAEEDVLIEIYNSIGELVPLPYRKVETRDELILIGIEMNGDVSPGIYLVRVKNGTDTINGKISINP